MGCISCYRVHFILIYAFFVMFVCSSIYLLFGWLIVNSNQSYQCISFWICCITNLLHCAVMEVGWLIAMHYLDVLDQLAFCLEYVYTLFHMLIWRAISSVAWTTGQLYWCDANFLWCYHPKIYNPYALHSIVVLKLAGQPIRDCMASQYFSMLC